MLFKQKTFLNKEGFCTRGGNRTHTPKELDFDKNIYSLAREINF